MNNFEQPQVTLVAAMSENRVIGRENSLPWHIPEELKHFKRTTLNTTLIMGRKTFESIGRPLPNRETIVLTNNPRWNYPNVLVCGSIDDALKMASKKVMIIGGGKVFEQALPIANKMMITTVHGNYEGDSFFPEISKNQWACTSEERHELFTVKYYDRKS